MQVVVSNVVANNRHCVVVAPGHQVTRSPGWSRHSALTDFRVSNHQSCKLEYDTYRNKEEKCRVKQCQKDGERGGL
jgi:hypothetical protein